MNADPYANKTEQYFSGARPEMLGFIPKQARDFLEVGCGRGTFAAALKTSRPARITAIEPFEAAAEAARPQVDELLPTTAEEGLAQLEGRLFDCIVFNDVLEHLVDPEVVLKSAGRLLRSDGVVVASIPNMRFMPVFRGLVLRGEWRYGDDGVLDRTHLHFFTQKSIVETFLACGYSVHRIEGINSRPLSWKFRLLDLLTANAFADTRHQQFAVVASSGRPPAPVPGTGA